MQKSRVQAHFQRSRQLLHHLKLLRRVLLKPLRHLRARCQPNMSAEGAWRHQKPPRYPSKSCAPAYRLLVTCCKPHRVRFWRRLHHLRASTCARARAVAFASVGVLGRGQLGLFSLAPRFVLALLASQRLALRTVTAGVGGERERRSRWWSGCQRFSTRDLRTDTAPRAQHHAARTCFLLRRFPVDALRSACASASGS